ncbi:MAG: hypothetical protein E4H36_13470 [Spirochaetales bacterium]|nr:MAG: hypothetical protein E4H36_13470 [Spirochaetales bacterium]
MNFAEICRYFGVPAWKPVKAWTRKSGSVAVEESGTPQERAVRYRVGHKEFTAKWILGPDGDWWQSEYPVKTAEDLTLFRALTEEESIIPAPDLLAAAVTMLGESGVPALQLPSKPFARLLLEMVGYSEGLFILMEGEDELPGMMKAAEERYAGQVKAVVEACRGIAGVRFAYSPDNLDASFISSAHFEAYMLEGYRAAADILHGEGYIHTVHAGGPVGSLLDLVKDSGIDCIAGICGPPQGDTPLPEARRKAGPDLVLWGGLAQDFFMPSVEEDDFITALAKAETESDSRCIIGIADHVPVEASLERIKKAASFPF